MSHGNVRGDSFIYLPVGLVAFERAFNPAYSILNPILSEKTHTFSN